MIYIKSILLFIQNQLLSMKWLSVVVYKMLEAIGLNNNSMVFSTIHFFIYDVIKIIILLCLMIFIISYIQSYFPVDRSKRILSKFKGIKANIIGALLGTVTPFCSCSSIPLFIGFTRSNLPLGVTFSFLISSPMVDLASLVLLVSTFGLKIAIAYVILGLFIAIIGGSLIEKLNMNEYIEDFVRGNNVIEIKSDSLSFKERINYSVDQVNETFKKVFPYILVGVGIGSIIHNWIPSSWIETTLGNNDPFGVILGTLVGIPIYSDIFGVIPIGEALLNKGALLGSILSFMMAVTTLSFPSLIMLRKVVKPKLLLLFILICSVGIIFVGYLFNIFEYLLI